jgi:ParB-like chromosome segregation protein Spo0J
VDGFEFPRSQRELIRAARAEATQVAFAKMLGVDRSCLSRYESEALGAPTSVLNHCLKVIAHRAAAGAAPVTDVQRALRYAQQLVVALEAATTDGLQTPSQRRSGRVAVHLSTSSGSTEVAASRTSKRRPP